MYFFVDIYILYNVKYPKQEYIFINNKIENYVNRLN